MTPRKATPSRPQAVRSQGETAGAQLVETLNGLVDELIRENRRLRREVEKLTAGGGATAVGLERGLRAIQKRIETTLALAAPAKASARRTVRPRRKPAPPGT